MGGFACWVGRLYYVTFGFYCYYEVLVCFGLGWFGCFAVDVGVGDLVCLCHFSLLYYYFVGCCWFVCLVFAVLVCFVLLVCLLFVWIRWELFVLLFSFDLSLVFLFVMLFRFVDLGLLVC